MATAYQKRVAERDKARGELGKLQKDVWRLQKLATNGTGQGIGVCPFTDMEGSEESPKLNEDQLRRSIMEVRAFNG